MDYESDYRRQYCRDRVARASDEYRRVQRPPRSDSKPRVRVVFAQIQSFMRRVRRRAPERAPAYRS